MSYVELSNNGKSPFEQLMGHLPEVLNQWRLVEVSLLESKQFTPDFLEQIRRTLAYQSQCNYCIAKSGPAEEDPSSVQLVEAIRFAKQFSLNSFALNEDDIIRLKRYFKDSEVVELVAFCSFFSACQKFAGVLGLKAAEEYN